MAAPMQAVASTLSLDEMLAVAAYLASLPPTAAPSANQDTLR
jgi:cytochrome c553